MPVPGRGADGMACHVDVVVPVRNALGLVRDCLTSILADGEAPEFHLWLVDDASDVGTARFLQGLTADPRVRYLRNDSNLGFLRSANIGIAQGQGRFVALVNSDVTVPTGWLRRLLACAHCDPRIACANPLTNRAAHIDLPIPPGASFLGVDRFVSRRRPAYPDIVTGVGFCMLLRREALAEVGLFDEAYGKGYCEESDLCMRLTGAGWRTVIADDVFVWHRGAGSFGGSRDERYRVNRALFDQRWKARYEAEFRQFRRRDPLRPLRTVLRGDTVWSPRPLMWETARAARQAWREREPTRAAKALARGAFDLPRARQSKVAPAQVEQFTAGGAPTVTYLLPRTVVAGGVLSVLQLANELVLLGVECRVATCFVDPAVRAWLPLRYEPMVFHTSAQLVQDLPPSDIVVATHWSTVAWAQALISEGKARRAAYFVQDYEPWFVPESDGDTRARIEEGYRRFDHLIVKSDWLAQLLRALGRTATKIPIGLDLGTFYERDTERCRDRIVAMARPGTRQRGYETLVSSFQQISALRPTTEFVVFGDDGLREDDLGVSVRNLGMIANQDRLAELYSSAALFIDSSDFQGFGRCALEAMACGAAAVVTGVGGVGEYARDEDTTLVVAPRQPDSIAGAALRLLGNEALRSRLANRGRLEAQRFCHKAEAKMTAEYFRKIDGA